MQRLRASLEQLDQVIDTLEHSLTQYAQQQDHEGAQLKLVATAAKAEAERAERKSSAQVEAVETMSTRLDAAIAQLESILKD